MELTIFKNIIYGELKPWSSTAIDEKFYRQNLSKDFIQPNKTINSYYKVLKELHRNKPNLFNEDGLEVYMAQKDTDRKTEILHPLVKLDLKEPTNSTQKFYHYLLKNETTRLSNRIFKCVNKEISEIQQKEIIQNVVKSCKDLLLRIGTDQEAFPKTNLTEYVIPQLITNVIRLLKETELLYPSLLHSLPSDKISIFGELLQIDSPDYKIEETTPEFTTVKNILLDIDNFKLEKDARFSFGFNGNIENLKSVIYSLNRNIELLNDDKTSPEDLLAIFTSKDLKRGDKQIHLNCETTQFGYIVSRLTSYFTNFNPTTIETSNLFFSKKGTLLKRNNLYKNKSKYTKENDTIDSIIKQL
jgi:hypothetical protein